MGWAIALTPFLFMELSRPIAPRYRLLLEPHQKNVPGQAWPRIGKDMGLT